MTGVPPEKPVAFISYRRADADAMAGRIRDRLLVDLPGWTVFMDVASVDPGANFMQAIDDTLAQSSVLLALIGRRWLGDAEVRIHNPDDLVRYEIKSALTAGVRVIPVLLNDARMPKISELPDDIAALTTRNALELRHSRFDDDFRNLVKGITGPSPVASQRQRRGASRPIGYVLTGALLGLVLALAGLIVHFETTGKSASERIGDDGATLVIPVAVITGGLIGYWRALRRR
ncbi:MAG: toll/interleukin-1 receptor domain-containing protein [Xanthobacteraceae bacterium]